MVIRRGRLLAEEHNGGRNKRIGELHDMKKVAEQKLGAVRSVDENTGVVTYSESASYINAKAIALMTGKPLPSVSSSGSEEYLSAHDLEVELAAIDKAIEMMGARMNNTTQLAARRCRETLVPDRQKIVDELVRTAHLFRNAVLAECEFVNAVAHAGLEQWAAPLNFGVLRFGSLGPHRILQELNVWLGFTD